MPITDEQLVDVAVKRGLITAETVMALRLKARRDRIGLLDAVTSYGRFPVSTLYRALADLRGLQFMNLNEMPDSSEFHRRLPPAIFQFIDVLPVHEEGPIVVVATADPDDQATLDAICRILGRPIQVCLADPEALNQAAGRLLSVLSGRNGLSVSARPLAVADPVALLDRIFKEAFLHRASDIHFEPQAVGLQIRIRVDGALQRFQTLPTGDGSGVVSRIKVLAGLDIAEQRAPQDGGFTYHLPGVANQEIDIRIATCPTRWGERATLRLLGISTSDLTLEAIGMSTRHVTQFEKIIKQPHGLILLTGPTGGGKTTTLYAALREINRSEINIMTVEDPIEYVIPGISQIHVDGERMTFASTLRALLRHDPDVLMVGEIRDAETADVALKAAMTGHLVFSSLHTHSACGAITRLADLECERYLIGSTLIGVIAQRLVRRLCPLCKKPRPATQEETSLFGAEERTITLYKPEGCANCVGSGFRGRIGLFETLWINKKLGEIISKGGTEAELAESAADSLTSLFTDGKDKVLSGLTSLEEVLTVVLPDHERSTAQKEKD